LNDKKIELMLSILFGKSFQTESFDPFIFEGKPLELRGISKWVDIVVEKGCTQFFGTHDYKSREAETKGK